MLRFLSVALVCVCVHVHAGEEVHRPCKALSFHFDFADKPSVRPFFDLPISRSLGIKIDLDAKAKSHPVHPQFRQWTSFVPFRR